MMSIKEEYHQAYSAFRWDATYDNTWDYFHRHYPRFDESRKVDQEHYALSPLAIGGAYKTLLEMERQDPLRDSNRYRDRLIKKREDSKRIVKYTYEIHNVKIEYADGHIEMGTFHE